MTDERLRRPHQLPGPAGKELPRWMNCPPRKLVQRIAIFAVDVYWIFRSKYFI